MFTFSSLSGAVATSLPSSSPHLLPQYASHAPTHVQSWLLWAQTVFGGIGILIVCMAVLWLSWWLLKQGYEGMVLVWEWCCNGGKFVREGSGEVANAPVCAIGGKCPKVLRCTPGDQCCVVQSLRTMMGEQKKLEDGLFRTRAILSTLLQNAEEEYALDMQRELNNE